MIDRADDLAITNLRAGCPREPVIAAWGIGQNGQKVLRCLMNGSKEEPRRSFQDMRAREFELRQLDALRKDLAAEGAPDPTGHLARAFLASRRLDPETQALSV